MVNHFYGRYGLALTMLNNKLESPDEVTPEMLISELENGQNRFRLEPLIMKIEDKTVKFQYLNKTFLLKNNECVAKKGAFIKESNRGVCVVSYDLSPTITTTAMNARILWRMINEMIKKLQEEKDVTQALSKKDKAKQTIMPLSGRYGKQDEPRATLLERIYCTVTTTTPYKPALIARTKEGGKIKETYCSMIPDLKPDDMEKFIFLFKKMLISEAEKLDEGVAKEVEKNSLSQDYKKAINQSSFNDERNFVIFHRPKICSGNFPYAPRQSALGSVGLLGAIGRWAKEANYWDAGKKVLDSLKERPIYIVEYGNAKSVSYGHWIVELAKENFLCDIIDAIQYSHILSEEKRDLSSPKYQLFFLFASRFFQLFEQKSFQDFLSIRAEYPQKLEKLFNTYFIKAMELDETVVHSARALGHWLNSTAYWAALKEAENRDKQGDKEMIRKLKAKFLAEMESTVFAAKSHDALLAQVVTRAGRLSQSDAPNAATLFFDAVAAGKLTLEESKNLIVAYSRLRSSAENNEQEHSSESSDGGTNSESESDAESE